MACLIDFGNPQGSGLPSLEAVEHRLPGEGSLGGVQHEVNLVHLQDSSPRGHGQFARGKLGAVSAEFHQDQTEVGQPPQGRLCLGRMRGLFGRDAEAGGTAEPSVVSGPLGLMESLSWSQREDADGLILGALERCGQLPEGGRFAHLRRTDKTDHVRLLGEWTSESWGTREIGSDECLQLFDHALPVG